MVGCLVVYLIEVVSLFQLVKTSRLSETGIRTSTVPFPTYHSIVLVSKQRQYSLPTISFSIQEDIRTSNLRGVELPT